jgi:hypothetical protein
VKFVVVMFILHHHKKIKAFKSPPFLFEEPPSLFPTDHHLVGWGMLRIYTEMRIKRGEICSE